MAATRGYLGSGARYSRFKMKANEALSKGDVVALDGTPELIQALTTTHELIVGIALETKTAPATGSDYMSVCTRGVCEVTAKGAINGGDRVRNSTATAGQVMKRTIPTSAGANPTQAEYNAAWQDEYANLGFALEDIADGAVGKIMVNKN